MYKNQIEILLLLTLSSSSVILIQHQISRDLAVSFVFRQPFLTARVIFRFGIIQICDNNLIKQEENEHSRGRIFVILDQETIQLIARYCHVQFEV